MGDYNDINGEDDLNTKLNRYFAGRIVRKDLTKKIKEVPTSRSMYLNTSLVNTAPQPRSHLYSRVLER